MPRRRRRRAPGVRQARIELLARRLTLLLSDGLPHSNAEIHHRIGMAWNDPLAPAVRRYVRDRGVYITPHSIDGFWVMTDDATQVRKHSIRRARNAYAEACRNARACAGACARNPHDIGLAQELAEHQRLAYMYAGRLGKTPMEVATDLTPGPTPPGLTTL